MKRLLLPLLLAFSCTVSAQEVVNAEVQAKSLRFVLNLVIPIGVKYDVNNYKITYTTTDAFGQPDTVTGLLSIPDNDEFVRPLAVYNHGTIASRELAPSVEGVLERLIVQGLAGNDFITMAPDYLGLGDSDGQHPYLHADTEASVGRDMIIAVRKWLDAEEIRYNDQVFVTGYSQGGHASAALHERLEANLDDGIDVTAAAHLSAPFDILVPSPEVLGVRNAPPVLLAFFNHTLISYNYVYDLYGGVEGLFVEPYLTQAQLFLAEELDVFEMGDALDSLLRLNDAVLGAMYTDEFLTDVLDNDPTLVQAFEANDVFNFAPASPTLIYYCNADLTVNPANSILADSVMRSLGALGVTLEDGGALDHGDCAIPAALRAIAFFQDFANIYSVSLGEPSIRPDLTLVPNPVSAGDVLWMDGLQAGTYDYTIYDISGRQTALGQSAANGRITLPNALPKGWNVLRLGLEDGSSVVRRFLVK